MATCKLTPDLKTLLVANRGQFPKYTSMGSYPLVYLDASDNALCADCARASLRSDTSTWPVTADAHYEGAPISCEECSTEIASAYGEHSDADTCQACDNSGYVWKTGPDGKQWMCDCDHDDCNAFGQHDEVVD